MELCLLPECHQWLTYSPWAWRRSLGPGPRDPWVFFEWSHVMRRRSSGNGDHWKARACHTPQGPIVTRTMVSPLYSKWHVTCPAACLALDDLGTAAQRRTGRARRNLGESSFRLEFPFLVTSLPRSLVRKLLLYFVIDNKRNKSARDQDLRYHP